MFCDYVCCGILFITANTDTLPGDNWCSDVSRDSSLSFGEDNDATYDCTPTRSQRQYSYGDTTEVEDRVRDM